MANKFRIAGLLAVTLVLTGVALAQQGNGHSAVAGRGAGVEARLAKQEQLRVPRPVRTQFASVGSECRADICNAPPKPAATEIVPVGESCSSLGTARDRNGRPIRRLCAFN
ncbi:hypothetical protein [Bosea sp. BH3]|uniref:hypothetical protein n=1 Tax=Bosea sp. BH3 TaxID=2871701 RepID=UPI0021CAF1B4|nr:hypothetical protein [Bosea sp. BH3]MCU4180210.1 hypothetical protein [Bosea sp. BH3]